MLTEKLRPRNLDEVVGQKHIVHFLKSFVKNKDVPHMLFVGNAGLGKTTCALALARELYGEDFYEYFIEINASDDRGIPIVRNKIKGLAQARTFDFPYKIILLDEVDAMTPDAQHALRRIIETNDESCRFILTCNYPNKLIEPLKNRCIPFRFTAIPKEDLKPYLDKLLQQLKIDVSESGKDYLVHYSKGSMRPILNILEMYKKGTDKQLTEEDFMRYNKEMSDEDIKKIVEVFKKSDVEQCDNLVDSFISFEGFTTEDIIENMRKLIIASKISSNDKQKALEYAGNIEYRIAVGANPKIQLKTFFVWLMLFLGD